jgi:hypothetical protein
MCITFERHLATALEAIGTALALGVMPFAREALDWPVLPAARDGGT